MNQTFEYPLIKICYRVTVKGKPEIAPVLVFVEPGESKPWNDAKGKGFEELERMNPGVKINFLNLRTSQYPAGHLYDYDDKPKTAAQIKALEADSKIEHTTIETEKDTPEPAVPSSLAGAVKQTGEAFNDFGKAIGDTSEAVKDFNQEATPIAKQLERKRQRRLIWFWVLIIGAAVVITALATKFQWF